VNPVVAVLLGHAILGESIGVRTFVAGGIIVASVALIISAKELSPPPDLGSGGRGPRRNPPLGERVQQRRPGHEREILLERVRNT